MSETPVRWGDEADDVFRGDLTAAAAYVTPAGGAVVVGVSPCGLADRERGTLGFTTSLGLGKKLERIVLDPHVALAYHARDHGFSRSPRYVLAQGIASVDLEPSPSRLREFGPQAVRYLGELKQGPVWDRLLREYYAERVFVDMDVIRVVTWPDLGASGEPDLAGADRPEPAPPQNPPKGGTGPRVDMARVAGRLSTLPHTGFLAHSYRPQLVGLATRILTGWLDVADDGEAVYAPHTSKGFMAPPRKNLLLVSNGLMAKVGYWRSSRSGAAERLRALASDR